VNFILLGIHTFLQSLMVGSFSSLLNPRTVCMGTIHTLAAFVAIALYTFQPNPQYDFTVLGNTLLTALTSLVVGSVLGLFYDMPLYDNLLSGALAVLFAVYLFHDMQKIVGGTHKKRQYGQKEYILAALNLYQDAISLYMQIAKLLHEQDKRKRRDD
jgi:FtsH-binding integral membrane protein